MSFANIVGTVDFRMNTVSSAGKDFPEITQIHDLILEHPYALPVYIILAQKYLLLDYPDLAAGAAYKALLLSDALQDEGDEYHQEAVDAIKHIASGSLTDGQPANGHTAEDNDVAEASIPSCLTATHYLPFTYLILAHSLSLCGCFKTAYQYCLKGCKMYPEDARLQHLDYEIILEVARFLKIDINQIRSKNDSPSWPDQGFVRREVYPWNHFEPDRLDELPTLNATMNRIAPKLEVRAVDLPNLASEGESSAHIRQLGVYAKEDIAPGSIVLDETSMLTANNKLQDALCDACSIDLPDLSNNEINITVSCDECETVFCSQTCYDQAMKSYHPALCDMDIESIAKDVSPAEAADALYSLLLLRALAMAETQGCHPLELKEVKYIWGDFYDSQSIEPQYTSCGGYGTVVPKKLPFDFEHNIRLPFHMLENMNIDIFKNPQYDVWVFNTLYAKFRGTASARLSGLGGRRVRGPEVSAVHPMWCLANHSCDPNVTWEWGGSIKFAASEERVHWKRPGSDSQSRSEPGIRTGEEVLNHYCDVQLPVKERREWARGALGGDCRCNRCMWEAAD